MILITGATGLVGRCLVERLMREELPLRCLLAEHRLRDLPWDAGNPHAPEIVLGAAQDEEALFRAVTGCHVVIHLENALWWGNRRELEAVELAGARALASVARAARVGRIITVSQLGAAASSAYTLHRVKGEVENILRGSGVAFTIIRSGVVYAEQDAFINHIASMLRLNPLFFLMPGSGETVLHPIYIDDLIEAVYRSLNLIGLVDQTVEIGGAEYMSMSDLMRTVMRVTGMRRILVKTPPWLLRWIAGFYSRLFRRSLMTSQWLDLLAANRTAALGNTYDHFGFQPRRFEETLLTYLPERRHLAASLRGTFRRRPRAA